MQRRQIIKGLAASSLLLGAGGMSAPLWAKGDNNADVIVIGAGLAGLTSARYLKQQGYNVLVLEARERIGGRILTLNSHGVNAEAGGLQIGQGYGLMRTYAEQLGLPLVSLGNYAKQNTFVINGQRISADDWPAHEQNKLEDKNILPSSLYYAALAAGPKYTLPSDWTSAKYAPLDISLQAYFQKQNISPEALRLMDANLNALSLHDLSAADAFYRLSLARVGGRGAQKVAGGNSRFTQALADDIGDGIHRQKVVSHITEGANNVNVRCEDGSEYSAKRIVITTPFSALKDVIIQGDISASKRRAINEAVYTPVTQVHFAVKKQADVSMLAATNLWTDNSLGRVFSQVDDAGRLTYLTSWINGQQAKALDKLTVKEAVNIVKGALNTYYPGLKGKTDVVHHQSWGNERFSKGAYIQFAPGQVQALVPHMASVEGKLHFAGEHTEFMHSGMESAIVSGLRAAQELSDRL
ncbi:NAD(P)/FAD-dependent oxidoreductase [Paraglaciecola sp. 20A4]|uniref:flavin monoamine oxidase family protein n=1 Tax=Paraglaciecola sp. 20A4 TaxID=2687288 RepID=UPI00140E596E|nr:NAD(P)/FAD-dependent oxidoreductase [Paraglaciecola sp. 20A4]